MKERKAKRNSKWFGFLGFLGFKAFSYFVTKDVNDLYYFMYFAWFGYFFLSKINTDIEDELYIENDKKAKAFVGNLSIILLAIISTMSILLVNIDLKLLITITFVILILSYCIKFYLLEK